MQRVGGGGEGRPSEENDDRKWQSDRKKTKLTVEQVEHWMVKGSIMRTVTKSSLGFVPRGTSFGSKSAGMYLLRTLRSPMI